MSNTTPKLGLFKYDPASDGNMSFSIERALNNNWDIIDSCDFGGVVDKYTDGATWYRKYADGFKIMGGLVTMGKTEIPWTRPNLTKFGTMGGTTCACSETSEVNNAYGWYAFDGKDNTYWTSANTSPSSLTFYTPEPIKANSFYIKNPSSANYPITGNIYGSNNNSTWTKLASWSSGTRNFTVIIPSPDWFKYYKFECLSSTYANHMYLYEVEFNAVISTNVSNIITFPTSFSNTDYSYSVSYQSENADGYVQNKTVTGMTLNNKRQGAASWIAMGY